MHIKQILCICICALILQMTNARHMLQPKFYAQRDNGELIENAEDRMRMRHANAFRPPNVFYYPLHNYPVYHIITTPPVKATTTKTTPAPLPPPPPPPAPAPETTIKTSKKSMKTTTANNAVWSNEFPRDLYEIAKKKLGIKSLADLPTLNELGELLGTTNNADTIKFIRQLTSSEQGIALMKAYIETSDYNAAANDDDNDDDVDDDEDDVDAVVDAENGADDEIVNVADDDNNATSNNANADDDIEDNRQKFGNKMNIANDDDDDDVDEQNENEDDVVDDIKVYEPTEVLDVNAIKRQRKLKHKILKQKKQQQQQKQLEEKSQQKSTNAVTPTPGFFERMYAYLNIYNLLPQNRVLAEQTIKNQMQYLASAEKRREQQQEQEQEQEKEKEQLLHKQQQQQKQLQHQLQQQHYMQQQHYLQQQRQQFSNVNAATDVATTSLTSMHRPLLIRKPLPYHYPIPLRPQLYLHKRTNSSSSSSSSSTGTDTATFANAAEKTVTTTTTTTTTPKTPTTTTSTTTTNSDVSTAEAAPTTAAAAAAVPAVSVHLNTPKVHIPTPHLQLANLVNISPKKLENFLQHKPKLAELARRVSSFPIGAATTSLIDAQLLASVQRAVEQDEDLKKLLNSTATLK